MRLLSAFTSDTDKALWRLALPMIFSNITVPLLGLVDTAVIGHLDSPTYLGGVAVGSMATSFLFMLLLFLRMSTTGLTAQALGAQNPQGLARAFMQPLLLAVLAGMAIVLLRYPLIELALKIVGGDGAVLEQARLFLEIRWLSAPAALANMVILGWLLGVQYVRAPVILLIVGNLLNIVLDIWLVMGLGWNVQGAATATAISEYATLLLGLGLSWRVMRIRGISVPMLRQAWRGNLRRLLALNRDIMLRSLLLQLCFASLTIFGARLGGEVVAVNAVLMNLLTFTAYALDGFAYAVEAHSGHAYGARDDSQLRKVWRAACRQACLVALGFGLLYAVAGQQIIAALTSLPELRALANHYLPWQVVLPLVGVWCYLLDGMFIGATRGAEMRNSMAVAAAGYGLTLFTLPVLGNHGLWLALAVFLSLRGIALGWIWHRHRVDGTWFAADSVR
ncbi:MATE family efflux transporter DinF [Serratia proteamaculans]|jgi:MATE family multidrug resistance protein|uniref:MATE family efflux transporter DinF n=1 Tax=Serratia proteamaculans TaxID=28151 RepID=UPI000D87C8B6|nr:MATE family efflux transporter DinF [Serratia proteamaculans]SPZ51553.1 Multidrug export protein mepA [Serratia quinivorans]NWA72355.1 MATE family efflux transporter DinF [Serratia proteamaculans]CAI0906840.1 Multidrug export protein mepA [Serratia proteamaculans]CAI1076060.1 Multidrug export protein mepA [Serratia proteamaculans]CAI1184369.1 Multidrug export protein mepA [Serratia proteamaculans]